MIKTVTTPAATGARRHTQGDALAAHVVESELLVGLPRPVEAIHPRPASELLLAAFFVLLAPAAWVAHFYPSLAFWCLLPPALVGAFLLVRTIAEASQPSQRYLLAHGFPKPAVVSQIEPAGDGVLQRVTYVYQTKANPRRIDSLLLTPQQVAAYQLHRWKTFTLLAHPDNEYAVLPYFLVRKYKVAGT